MNNAISNRQVAAAPTLHMLNKAPSHPRFHACLAAVSPDDHLLLLENAVIGLVDATVSLPLRTSALARDCRARGLIEAPDSVVLDMRGMVELTDRFPRIVSW